MFGRLYRIRSVYRHVEIKSLIQFDVALILVYQVCIRSNHYKVKPVFAEYYYHY